VSACSKGGAGQESPSNDRKPAGWRAHTVRHGQGRTAWRERLETEVVGMSELTTRGESPGVRASTRAEPGTGADAQKRPLRFRFRARLTAGVRHAFHQSGKEVRQQQWSWTK
jgi:hypothetical protein